MFIDELNVTVHSGRGGDGVVSFRHEKGVEFGGPNGGDGGHGGDITFISSTSANTLGTLRGRKVLRAEPGDHGRFQNQTGKSGKSLIVEVPVGTVVRRTDDNSVITDLATAGESIVVAKGGRGGRGNTAFATPTNRTPKYREMGEKSTTRKITLEVRLMADVGLVGLPNAGKSTLLARLSAAKPKIADYPFTTLEPLLGIVERNGAQFTMADLPGLIRGAHLGKGLGIRFLRHIERTRVILHLVDATSENPQEDYEIIRDELDSYGHGLAEKKSILVLTKTDALPSDAEMPLREHQPLVISSHSGVGLDGLCYKIAELLSTIPVIPPLRSEMIVEKDSMPISVTRDGDIFIIKGDAVERYLLRRVPEDIHDWRRFWQTLVRWGAADELKRLGVKERDTVRIGDHELEYVDDEEWTGKRNPGHRSISHPS